MIIYQRYVEKAEKIIFYITKKVINLKFAKRYTIPFGDCIMRSLVFSR